MMCSRFIDTLNSVIEINLMQKNERTKKNNIKKLLYVTQFGVHHEIFYC